MQQAVHLYVQMPILQRKMLVGKIPNPFRSAPFWYKNINRKSETIHNQIVQHATWRNNSLIADDSSKLCSDLFYGDKLIVDND